MCFSFAASSNARMVASVFAILAMVYILVTYCLGYFWLKRYVSRMPLVARNQELQEHLDLIATAAITVSVLCGILTAVLIAYVAFAATHLPTPTHAPGIVMGQLFGILSALVIAVVVWYLWSSVRLKQKWGALKAGSEPNPTVERATMNCKSSHEGGGRTDEEADTEAAPATTLSKATTNSTATTETSERGDDFHKAPAAVTTTRTTKTTTTTRTTTGHEEDPNPPSRGTGSGPLKNSSCGSE